MILIADSGSTKTHWCLYDPKSETKIKELHTNGINPFYQTEVQIADEVFTNVHSKLPVYEIESIYFYGAGCSFPEKKEILSKAISISFPGINIEIHSDLEGAARAMLGRGTGIVCILGTGSNSCYYEAGEIKSNVSPLGFILGDEGSGAVLGKLLVSDLLKHQLTKDLEMQFFDETGLSSQKIMDGVYRKPFPNRFLASMSYFLEKHKDDPSIHRLIVEAFRSFFVRNVRQYEQHRGVAIHFIGSIAFLFADELREAAEMEGMRIASIMRSPMDGMIAFHQPPKKNLWDYGASD